MSNWMVTVSFRYDLEPERFDAENGPEIAQRVSSFPGLLWKIWLHSAQERRCQGVYRFADEASACAYVEGPVVSHLREAAGYRDVDAQVWGVLEENSRITHAPGLDEPALV